MSNDQFDDSADAVPGVYTGPEGRPGRVLLTLVVDGEVFAVRRSHDGGTNYDWVSGRNRDYGFSSSANPEQPIEMHRQSMGGFLNMIDPETGYIAED